MNVEESKRQCPNLANNLENCTCTYTSCTKMGLCCHCVSYHRSRNEIPGCFFPESAESTYDRSVSNFIKSVK